MALVTPNVGTAKILDVAIKNGEDLKLCLFSNNVTPANATIIGDLTECTGSGYAEITLTAGSWVITAAGGVGGDSLAAYAEQTFTFSGAITTYGYYVKGASSGVLYWAEAFGEAYTYPSGGGTLKVTPKFELD